MTDEQRSQLNRFFVRTFNSILAFEDKALIERGIENLSVKETHVIETVIRLEQVGQNTMTAIAEQLNITVGALSTAVQTLIGKGYLQRSADANDRRLVLMSATNTGFEANKIHESFHEQMLNYVAQQMNAEDLARLTHSLEQLSLFFESLTKKSTGRN